MTARERLSLNVAGWPQMTAMLWLSYLFAAQTHSSTLAAALSTVVIPSSQRTHRCETRSMGSYSEYWPVSHSEQRVAPAALSANWSFVGCSPCPHAVQIPPVSCGLERWPDLQRRMMSSCETTANACSTQHTQL